LRTKLKQIKPQFQVIGHNVLKQSFITGEKTLNGLFIDDRAFYPLVKRIITQYPGSLVHDQYGLCIWNYPVEGMSQGTEEFENGFQQSEESAIWTEQQFTNQQFEHQL
jgi:hypothetical protein